VRRFWKQLLPNIAPLQKFCQATVVVQFGESLTSFGMTNPLGVISSGSEKSFSTQKLDYDPD
jgi:hypothetical protein